MLNDLLCCPFCGKEAMISKVRRPDEGGYLVIASTAPDSDYKWEFLVECSNCGCATGNWMKTKKGAINRWNRRAI